MQLCPNCGNPRYPCASVFYLNAIEHGFDGLKRILADNTPENLKEPIKQRYRDTMYRVPPNNIMIEISVRLFGGLRDQVDGAVKGRLTVTLPASATVADALSAMQIGRPVLTAVNDTHNSSATTPLSDGDTLFVFEQAAGG